MSFGQANFEGYTTEVIFQVFQKTFGDHFLPCFYTNGGFGGGGGGGGIFIYM